LFLSFSFVWGFSGHHYGLARDAEDHILGTELLISHFWTNADIVVCRLEQLKQIQTYNKLAHRMCKKPIPGDLSHCASSIAMEET
jgi:hypothetical protein